MGDAAKRLDDVSANLAEVLRHADALLAEWEQFGASVRAQVAREAEHIGRAVADGTGAAVERAVSAQLAALTKELTQLEQRVRSASRGLADQRTTDRRLLGGIAIGVAIAIALLVVLVLRTPTATLPAAPVPEATRVDVQPAPPPDARPIDAAVPADAPPPPPADAARSPRHR